MIDNRICRGGWLLLVVFLGQACTTGRQGIPDACVVSSGSKRPCSAGLVGYSCAGSARPDENADFVGDVPLGLVCTDEGKVEGSNEAYCCTAAATACAYDPAAGCAAPAYGYECRGSDRPEAFDPTLFCGEGLVYGDLIVYCCSSTPPAQGCAQVAGHACPTTLVGWTCHDQSLPSEAELGDNQSRADFNLLVCSVPTVVTTGTGTDRQYCCFTPTLVPIGGSCLEDTSVPGCAADSFGFACTGPDTPDQDYASVACSGSGMAGRNAQGYAATLYCCQYRQSKGS
jgi:hypothetical protein